MPIGYTNLIKKAATVIKATNSKALGTLIAKEKRLANLLITRANKQYSMEKIISDLEKIKKMDFSSRFQYAKDLSGGDFNIKEILDTWLTYFRNLLHLNLGEERFEEKYPLSKATCLSTTRKKA